ncbi:MAG: DUF4093 domain-containing protein [Clostridia bacterium]|nr:DUF4093 domain-containing protein [Clostridia bacterium]
MIRLSRAVIVEGKYDKIHLENFIDTTVIEINGFGIYKDREKQKLIKMIAAKSGIVIITDSDNAGNQLRAYIKRICVGSDIIDVYLPQIPGREKRKSEPSKQGILGAEGLPGDVIIAALKKSGADIFSKTRGKAITKAELYSLGLSGCENSKAARESFCRYAGLPLGLSANAFTDMLNALFNYDEFIKVAKLWRQDQAKN